MGEKKECGCVVEVELHSEDRRQLLRLHKDFACPGSLHSIVKNI